MKSLIEFILRFMSPEELVIASFGAVIIIIAIICGKNETKDKDE